MKWAAFDVETLGRSADWRIGAVYSDQLAEAFEDHRQAVDVLREHARQGYTLAAHNAEYDVVNGLWRLNQDVTIHYYNATFTTAYWFFDRRRPSCQVWDTLQLSGGMSLRALGESLGVPKYEMPQRLRGVDPDRFKWVCELHGVGECERCYVLRDAEICYRFISEFDRFMAGYGLEVSRTIASNAVRLWAFMDPGQQQTVRSDKITKLATAALHGGRVEPFMYGSFGPVHVYDYRNLYAWVMASAPMPDCRYLIHAKGWPRHLNWSQVEGVIEATVFQPATRYPVLPVVHAERIYYPVGLFRDSWAICELREAISRGAELRDVHQVAWTPRVVFPFANFTGGLLPIEAEYRSRNDPRRVHVKTLLNAVPGRLGMVDGGRRRVYRRRLPGMKAKDLAGAELQYAAGEAYLVREHQVPRPPTTSNVLWAANITARARIRLLEAFDAAGALAIYTDTDSVFTTVPLAVGPDDHGQLVDKGVWDYGLFLSPKQYRLENRAGDKILKAKGVPREVVEAYFARGKVEYDSNLGVIRALGLDMEPGTWMAVTRERALTPARRQLLDPSALIDEGKWTDTEPIVFGPDGPDRGA
jgi:hypothetical protein